MSSFFTKYTTPIIEAALDYASRGFPVFPVHFAPEESGIKGKKRPLVAMGYKAATTDPEEIKSWWTSWPDAMISIPTGLASGLLVFSVDSAQAGQEKWEAFAAENSIDLEGVVCQETPSGGREYIFKFPVREGRTIGCKKLAKGVEIQGEGGSFVVAPSAYRVERGMGKYDEGQYAVVYNSEPEELTPEAVEKVLALGTVEDGNKGINEVIKRLKAAPVEEITMPEPEEEVEPEEEEEEKYAEELPSLPLEALPPRLAELISGVSRVFCVNHWLPFAAALKTASTAVGANIILEHRQQSPGHTWLCLVGAPSLGKSEITRFFGRPIADAERVYCERYSNEFAYFSEESKEWEARQAAARKKEEAFKEKKPEPPTKTTLYVDDVTPESLAWVLSQNPGGVSWDCDEIRALLSSFGRYGGKGSGEAAKARMLSMYSGSPLKIDRKGVEASTFIPAAWLSIFGTVQPSILPKIFEKDDRASGFLQRFMFIKADATPPIPTAQRPQLKSFERVVQEIFGGLVGKVERLVPVRPDEQQDELKERTKPKIVRLEQEAAQVLDNFIDTIKKEAFYLSGQGEDAEEAQSRAGRWCDQLPRLVLLLHCLKAVEERNEIVGIIQKETVENAITVFKTLMAHSVAAWNNIKGMAKKEAPRIDLIKIVDKYIKKEGSVYEIHYAEQIENEQKIVDAILNDIGTNGGTTATKQALSKSLISIGFLKGKTMHGQKYSINKGDYEKMLAK